MNRTNPSVSLIVSTYNWPEALLICLLSITHQTMLPDEVIIADDGSREDTVKLIREMQKKFPCPLIHVWHEDTGFKLASIRNKAIAKSSMDYIIQIDGDIILDKHFVEDHVHMASAGCFIAGSRAMLNEEFSKYILENKVYSISVWNKNVRNKLNAIRICLLSHLFKFNYKKSDPYYGRGCNMSFWKADFVATNGYNENMTGWGKEDSELIVRFTNMGLKRIFIKFRGIEFHIWHSLSSRDSEPVNKRIYDNSIKNKTLRTDNGLNNYL